MPFTDMATSTYLENSTVDLGMNISDFAIRNVSGDTKVAQTCAFTKRIIPPIKISYQATVFVLALLGNICVIAFIKRWKVTRSSRMYIFIENLCIADILVALFHILPQLIEFCMVVDYGSDLVCKLIMYGRMVPIFLSTYMMLATAIDRYREVFYPSSHTTKGNYILLSIAWIVPFVFSIPQLLNFEMAEKNGLPSCRMTAPVKSFRAYLLFFNINIYIIPLFMLGFIYGRLSWVIWKKEHPQRISHTTINGVRYSMKERPQRISHTTINGVRYSIQGSGMSRSISGAHNKSILLTFVMVVVYFICWTPFMVAHYLQTYGKAPTCSKC